MLCYLRQENLPKQCPQEERSHLHSSCSVCVLPGEASLVLILFIDLEWGKALGKRVKGMETQMVFTEGERLEKEQMDTCRSTSCCATRGDNRDLAFMITEPPLRDKQC